MDRDGAILAKLFLGLMYLSNEIDKTFSWFWHALFWPVSELELTNSSWLTVLGKKILIAKISCVSVTKYKWQNKNKKKPPPHFTASSLRGTKSQTNFVLDLIYHDEAAHLALDISGVGLSVQIYAPGRCPERSNHCKDCTDGVFSKGTSKGRLWPLYQSWGRVAIVSELRLTGR